MDGTSTTEVPKITTSTSDPDLIPPKAEVDPTGTGQHGRPVCRDDNHDGTPDSPPSDPLPALAGECYEVTPQ